MIAQAMFQIFLSSRKLLWEMRIAPRITSKQKQKKRLLLSTVKWIYDLMLVYSSFSLSKIKIKKCLQMYNPARTPLSCQHGWCRGQVDCTLLCNYGGDTVFDAQGRLWCKIFVSIEYAKNFQAFLMASNVPKMTSKIHFRQTPTFPSFRQEIWRTTVNQHFIQMVLLYFGE